MRVSDESPVFTKARVVPLAIRSKYDKALEKLVAEDIIEKVARAFRVGITNSPFC